MNDNEKLLGDAVGSTVEKVLMNVGPQSYAKVKEIVEQHNLTFFDCYQNPDVLNFALKQLFEDAYLAVVEKIKKEFAYLAIDNCELANFLQKLNE